ncbi:bifunctional serine/threonine-protein kinase/formylglycine-generating enzyme family protein [Zooshikella ganghwensis]|uniref:bifunctional serine/threonine-protein kinase/formylglycine-generating enzyme family protein n=1 Tax=Zooshikella ganghwensis TaxID=202772 RepID=UPI0003FEE83F|nr:bifunctional serine/threonine-protein kinase/formylglycine-generating enzyme family protein [Zooshikella ganghwensis]
MGADKTKHSKTRIDRGLEVRGWSSTAGSADSQPIQQKQPIQDNKPLHVQDNKPLHDEFEDATVISQPRLQADNYSAEDATVITGNKPNTNNPSGDDLLDDKTVITGQLNKPYLPTQHDAEAETLITARELSTGNAFPYSEITGHRLETGHQLEPTQYVTHSQIGQPSSQQSSGQRVGIGSVLKARFELVEVLGSGGMGVVYKAIDRRKIEASDRNPYVAVKVLNEEFRQHPESLIALQREARKAQTLAHPNIVTVFDFDREDDVVFMTMELLQGKALDQLLREDYPDGLPLATALSIIRGIANGLTYAHNKNIIHSDFKPSNVFILEDGTAKVFDFGIARAAKTKTQEEGDKTLFDAGELGALTPAYASLEMLLGKEPDIRDDIYAFGCVVNECLTGKHPFNKLSALKAQEKKLQPKRAKILKNAQWKALSAALSFRKENRPASVQQFIDVFLGSNKRKGFTVFGVIVAMLAGLTPVIYTSTTSLLDERRATQVIKEIKQLPANQVEHAFELIDEQSPELQEQVLDATKDRILELLKENAFARVADAQGEPDFQGAHRVLIKGQQYYPDSAALNVHLEALQEKLREKYKWLIQQRRIYPRDDQWDMFDLLETARTIAPQHEILKNQELAKTYIYDAERAIQSKDYDLADRVLSTAVLLFPDNEKIIRLVDQIDAQRRLNKQSSASDLIENLAAENTTKALQLKINKLVAEPFANEQWSYRLYTQYQAVKKKLDESDEWLLDLQQQIAELFVNRARKLREAKRFTASLDHLNQAAEYAPDYFGLDDEKNILNTAQASYQAEQQAKQRIAEVNNLKQAFSRSVKLQDEKQSLKNYLRLRQLLGVNSNYIHKIANVKIMRLYLSLAEKTAKSEEYEQSIKLVKKGLEYKPKSKELLAAIEHYQVLLKQLEQDRRYQQQQVVVKLYQQGQKVNKDKLKIALAELKEMDKSMHQKVEKSMLQYYLQHMQRLSKKQPDIARQYGHLASTFFPGNAQVKKILKSLDPCEIRFAGHGINNRAICADRLANKASGPKLVVVPPYAQGTAYYAMSKYEISQADFAQYCARTKKCRSQSSHSRLPVTNISLKSALDYTTWLTKETGFTYRIPTDQEWLHAALTNKKSKHNEYNCRVKLGSKLLKGQSLLPVTSGRANPWGLVNVYGNAQEWVMMNGKPYARGGAYTDSLSECNGSLVKSHTGQADKLTTFRVVRNIMVAQN